MKLVGLTVVASGCLWQMARWKGWGVGAVGHSHSVSLVTGIIHDQGPACRHLGH